MFSRLISLLIAVFFICHLGLYLQYETIHPCRAAVARLVSEDSPMFMESAETVVGRKKARQALKSASGKMARSRGVYFCYRTALLGRPGQYEIKLF